MGPVMDWPKYLGDETDAENVTVRPDNDLGLGDQTSGVNVYEYRKNPYKATSVSQQSDEDAIVPLEEEEVMGKIIVNVLEQNMEPKWKPRRHMSYDFRPEETDPSGDIFQDYKKRGRTAQINQDLHQSLSVFEKIKLKPPKRFYVKVMVSVFLSYLSLIFF
jgi:hypothetical protein